MKQFDSTFVFEYWISGFFNNSAHKYRRKTAYKPIPEKVFSEPSYKILCGTTRKKKNSCKKRAWVK